MNPKQIKALQALLTQPTKAAAAKEAGIDESTLRRYLSDPEFQKEYKAAFSQLVTDATRQAQKSLSPALSALREIVEDDEESAGSRIAAARTTNARKRQNRRGERPQRTHRHRHRVRIAL